MVASHSQGPLQMNSSCQLPLLCAVMYIWYICYNLHTNDTINVTNQMVRNVVLWLVHFWHSKKPGQMNLGIEYSPFFFFYISQQCVSLSQSEWKLNERVCTAASLSSREREEKKRGIRQRRGRMMTVITCDGRGDWERSLPWTRILV